MRHPHPLFRGRQRHLVLFHGGHFGSHDAADCAEDWSLNFDGLAQWFHVAARSTPDARMYIYNRAGHFSDREHPAEFNAMLRSFIGRMT
ncbi:MAG TPA: hypothetical protein VFZ51_04430 [Woeseiaceae bacterium]